MIVYYLLKLIYFLFFGLVSLLPASDGLPNSVSTALFSFVSFAHSFDWLFPVNTLLTVFGIVMAVTLAMNIWHFVRYIVGVVRGSGS